MAVWPVLTLKGDKSSLFPVGLETIHSDGLGCFDFFNSNATGQ